MINGSSAINYEANKQIVTPAIKAEIRENYYFKEVGVSAATARRVYGRFKDLCLGYERDNESLITREWGTYAIIGSGITIGTGITWDKGIWDGKFYRVNDNLMQFYYVKHVDDNNHYIYRIETSGGTVWGNTELLYYGTSRIGSVAVGGVSQVYFTEGVDFPWDYAGGLYLYWGRYFIKSLRYTGSTWEANDLYTEYNIMRENYYTTTLNASRDGNDIDAIIFACRDALPVDYETSGLRIITTDGVNLLDSREYVDIKQHSYVIGMYAACFGAGTTLYALETEIGYWERIELGGQLVAAEAFIVGGLYSLAQGNYNNITALRKLTGRYASIIDGASEGNLFVFSGPTVFQELWTGISSLDVSDDIMNYQNQNNNRISITLGNYK